MGMSLVDLFASCSATVAGRPGKPATHALSARLSTSSVEWERLSGWARIPPANSASMPVASWVFGGGRTDSLVEFRRGTLLPGM